MRRYRWELVIFAGLVAGQRTTGMANELASPYGSVGSVSTAARPPQGRRSPVPTNNRIIRLPPTGTETLRSGPVGAGSALAGQGVDGTWRDNPEYIIINIDGKEMKLLKSGPEPSQPACTPSNAAEGTVQGRLLQNGAPLVNCRVVMVPLEREGLRDEDHEPMIGITNDQGVYRFEKVPAGKYKFTWLPEGTRQWIRRIQMKPDVIVRAGQNVVVKDIRAALRTIN
jgi:hypothetical protein